MYIQQLYTNCLSEAAYYIESDGEVAIIDPLRDVEAYLNLAAERKASIKYIFETHFHADFISGHLDLAKITGAPIIYGPGTQTAYPVTVASDGQQFPLGKLTLEVMHTPGHTLESSCYLLRDEKGVPHAVFTGDTLFVGDVGRPDLFSGNLSKEELAGLLYDSLHLKLATLPDQVLVYPAHGPGSSCGKNLGPQTFSTIGEQKASNYALKQQAREDFIKAVTDGLSAPPQYFPINARINKEGYTELDKVMEKGMQPITVSSLKELMGKEGIVLLDTRPAHVFSEGFIPGAISIGLEGRFAEWAGSLLPFDQPLVLVTEEGKEKESLIRLTRVGFENVIGYLEGGYAAWRKAGETFDLVIDVEADELAMDLPHDDKLLVLDVRKPAEFGDGHIVGAVNIPLAEMNDPASLSTIDEAHNIYVHCAGGYRSVIAASLLKRQGFHNLRNIVGGWNAIKEQKGIPVEKEGAVLN